MVTAIILFGAALVLSLIDKIFHYKDLSKILPPSADEDAVRYYRKHFKHLSFQPGDDTFALMAYIWTYLYIAGSVMAFSATENWTLRILLVLFVTGRFRALQEIGHHAAHGSLCPSRRFGEVVTNLLYQFPAFMPDIRRRHQVHVVEHHHSVNQPNDPDLKEMIDKGFEPGLSAAQFWLGVFQPLLPRGIINRLKECWSYLEVDAWNSNLLLRLSCVSVVIAVFFTFGLYQEFLFLYVVPVVVTYPLFYWLAHIALHRWFADCASGIPYHNRELIIGRPTDFRGVSGWIIRANIFPFGDSYHLAHSLFPNVRWNHLPQVDKVMKRDSRTYSANGSIGLFWGADGRPSAISELRDRMIAPGSVVSATAL